MIRKSNKKPILLLSADWHIKRENIEQIKDLICQQCNLADELKVDLLICLGDVFESRKGQEQMVFVAFEEILDYIYSRKKKLILFPGNHDKTNYSSSDSFLEPFQHHPAVQFFREPGSFKLESIECSIVPYYIPQLYIEKLNLLVTSGQRKRLLLSHIELTGSVNNDGSEIKNCLNKDLFKGYDLVLLGHYHNHQTIGKNIVHLPSICQKDFGEDSNKGFTILYDDLSWEIRRSKFKEFKKILIHVEDVMNGGIEKMLYDYDTSNMNVRFVVSGSPEQIKSLNVSELEMRYGVDIQTQNEEINSSIEFVENEEITEFNQSAIQSAFQEFCDDRKFNHDDGIKYLNKVFTNGN
jgi:exonuclease SbcD